VATGAGEYRRFWEQSLEKLDDVLGEMKAKGTKDGKRG